MDVIRQFGSNFKDALLLFDSGLMDVIDAAWRYRLAVLIDKEGETELVADSEGSWQRYWQQQSGSLLGLCASANLIVDRLPPGRFFVQMGEGIPHRESAVLKSATACLHVPSGRLIMADVSGLTNESSLSFVSVDVIAGDYSIRVQHLAPLSATDVIKGVFWTKDQPAITIQPVREQLPAECENFIDFRIEGIPEPSIANAIVKRVMPDGTLCDILVAPDVRSGYAWLSGRTDLSVGSQIRIRLLSKAGGRWKAEVIE